MNKLRFKLLALAAAAMPLVAAPTLVYARDGVSGGGSDSHGTTQANTTTNPATSTESTSGGDSSSSGSGTTSGSTNVRQTAETKTEAETTAEVETHTSKAETEGKNFLAGLQNKETKHTDQERQKNCQAAEKGLETKLANLQKNAATFQSRVNAVYQKALNYQAANNLNPTGFAQLVATADTAKVTASASVAALSGLSVNLDCANTTVAQNVATFRGGAQQARTDLIAYKTAVKAVLTALEGATTNG